MSGFPVLLCRPIEPSVMEQWVQKVAAQSGQQVDWGYTCGRILVRASGNIAAVKTVMMRLFSELPADNFVLLMLDETQEQ